MNHLIIWPIRTFSILNSILSPSTFHNGGCSILAELGTLSLEFTYLTDLTGNRIYEEKVSKHKLYYNLID